jgi:nucleotide-binding universal stress UspA family protein
MGNKDTLYRDSRPIALSRWGDPIVDHALVLLLRSSGYEVRVLPASLLNEPRALEGIRLLLLTPPTLTLSPLQRKDLSLQRKDLLTTLRDTVKDAGIPVLELITSSLKRRDEARDESWYMMPWPCRIEELEKQIEAASMEKSLRQPSTIL